MFSDALWANLFALLSLGVSAASLIYARGAYYREQPQLKFETWPVLSDDRPGYIQVKATNVGGRAISLVSLWGKDKTDAMGQYFQDHLGPGVLLEPHSVHDFQITHLPRGANQFAPEGNDSDLEQYYFEEMWIQDSRGDRHQIEGLTRMLPLLRAHYREWCERTGYWKQRLPEPAPSLMQPNHGTEGADG